MGTDLSAQNPSVILKSRQYFSENTNNPPSDAQASTWEIEDWSHSNVVDKNGDVLAAGFVYEEYTDIWGFKQRLKFPAIVKTSGDLEYIDEVQYKTTYFKNANGVYVPYNFKETLSIFQEMHEVIGEGYVAIGSGKLNYNGSKIVRPFLVYLNYDLTPKLPGVLRSYELDGNIVSRFYGVRSYRENGAVIFVVAGVRDGKNCIWKIDADGEIFDWQYTDDNANVDIRM